MPKEVHGKYGEQKEERMQLRLTPTAKARLMKKAQALNISASELIERVSRGESLEAVSLGESFSS